MKKPSIREFSVMDDKQLLEFVTDLLCDASKAPDRDPYLIRWLSSFAIQLKKDIKLRRN